MEGKTLDDELFEIKITVKEIEKNQKFMSLVLVVAIIFFVATLWNDGMMGQLWEFKFSEFFHL